MKYLLVALLLFVSFGIPFCNQNSYATPTEYLVSPMTADEDPAYENYMVMVNTTMEIRKAADLLIKVQCPDGDYFCYLASMYAMRRMTGELLRLADELYFETRPVLEVSKDLKVLTTLIGESQALRNPTGWISVDLSWSEYLETKENDHGTNNRTGLKAKDA